MKFKDEEPGVTIFNNLKVGAKSFKLGGLL